MLPQEIIRRKRDGAALTAEEIAFIVRGISNDALSEGQVAAFAMAVFFRGMSREECVALTREMTDSGSTIDWNDLELPGPVLDKHSTGGVGDKVSLMLAPIVAACGGFVPMISGRGLGHTGGTLDKLAAIPGYLTNPDLKTFRQVVQTTGCAIIGQTDDLAPADRRFYSVRDITATVESVPLITASILSKKLAAGLGGLVMDVKTGSGAFAADPGMARALAESIVSVATGAGLPTVALITDMNQVLGHTAGNAVEVAETIAYLVEPKNREFRLHEIVLDLAGEMLVLGGIAPVQSEGRRLAEAALSSGRAAERFSRMVAALGGPSDILEKPTQYLPSAPVVRPCPAVRTGYIGLMDTRAVGVAVIGLGGGRRRASDQIDPRVGFTGMQPIGIYVRSGDPVAIVHAASESDAAAAVSALQAAIVIEDSMPEPATVIQARIDIDGLREDAA
jgi:thymidine phosphorylase